MPSSGKRSSALSRRKRRTSSAKACSAALNPNSMGPLCCQRHPVPRKCARRDFARVRIPAAARRVQECMGAFHEGERAVQARAGVAAEARGLGRGISSGIPPGAQPFLEAQRLAVLAGIDTAGGGGGAPPPPPPPPLPPAHPRGGF